MCCYKTPKSLGIGNALSISPFLVFDDNTHLQDNIMMTKKVLTNRDGDPPGYVESSPLLFNKLPGSVKSRLEHIPLFNNM